MKKKALLLLAIVVVLAGIGGVAYLLTRPKILLVGFADQFVILAEKASQRSGVRIETWSREHVDDESVQSFPFARYKVIFVNGLRAEPYTPAVRTGLEAASNAGSRVIVLPPRQASVHRVGNADYEGEEKPVAGYHANGGVENWARMLRFAAATYLGEKHAVEPPLEMPDSGFYHPGSEEILTETKAYLDWSRKSGRWQEGAPTVVLDFASGWKTGMTAGTDALIEAFERRGFNSAAIFGSQRTAEYLGELKPDLIVSRSHGRLYQGDRGVHLLATAVDAPVIRGLTLMFERKTLDEYRQTLDGVKGPGLTIGTVVSELDGTIEPILLEALRQDEHGRRLEAPIEERIEKLVDRAERWIRLRRLGNQEKKVAIVYFAGIGKADFTAAGLNVPRSLTRFLRGMREAGYRVDGAPANPDALLAMMLAKGRNISESEPGEMERFIASADVTLLPVDEYAKWFARLPESMRRAVTEAYGPPPGTFMVARRDGKDYFVIPNFRFGNVTLLPQPARGAVMDSKLAHSDTVPPPHQYLAVYWWLQNELRADALVHYGTHGTYEFLPGRPVGQLDDDWSDRVVAALPNVYVYTMDNVGEALLAKRRGSAVMVSHQTPPIVAAQLSDSDEDFAELYRSTQRFVHQEPGALKEQMRAEIRKLARAKKLDADLRFDWTAKAPTDDEIRELDQYLDDLEEAKIPVGLHIHSQPNQPAELALTITEILGRPFVERVAGKKELSGIEYQKAKARAIQIVSSASTKPAAAKPATAHPPAAVRPASHHPGTVVAGATRPAAPKPEAKPEAPANLADDLRRIAQLKAAFAETADEIPATLRALDGRYVPPAGGGDPVRTPRALPTGKNLYGVNPAEIPTQAAWELGVKLADELLAAEKRRLGRWPRKVGFNLWPTEVIRQYGADLAQILWLAGVKPVWDDRGIVVDVELIPAPELKRPRVDVVVQAAAQFRDSFPDRMDLIDRAVRLAAAAADGENYIAENTDRAESELKSAGFSARDARILAAARVFSNGPGGYGTGLTGGVSRSGGYIDTKELTAEYLERAGGVFTEGVEWGKKYDKLYEHALKDTEAVSISHSSNTISALTLDHYFEYLGGMTMAIRDTTGKEAAAYLSDVRDLNKVRVNTVEEALAADLRSMFWNRKWIEGMKENDFSGASEIAKLASNLYGWQVTKPDAVQGYMWDEVNRIYIEDGENLGLKEWFDAKNPYAWQNLTATMIETARKGYWNPDAEVLRNLANEYARSVAKHGTSGSERTVANAALEKFVRDQLNAPGNEPGLQILAAFNESIERSARATDTAMVAGQRLVREIASAQTQANVRNSLIGIVGLLALAGLFWYGLRMRTRQ